MKWSTLCALPRAALGVALALCCASAAMASTVRVTLDQQDWDVSLTERGAFDAINGTAPGGILEQQVWWGNRELATRFAEAARAAGSGIVNPRTSVDFGAFFAYSLKVFEATTGAREAGSLTSQFLPSPNEDWIVTTIFTSSTSTQFVSNRYVFATAEKVDLREQPDIDTAAVPLPAGVWLLLTGLGAAAVVCRRRKSEG